ncbi:MAG: hypothetical protein IK131_01685 [Paludibacteraceae bacterium]|nr:hypothetical protein [Paludibacteraceae bacterium]
MRRLLLLILSCWVSVVSYAEEQATPIQAAEVNIREVSHGGLLRAKEDAPSIIFMREGGTTRYFLEMITTHKLDNLMLFYLGKSKDQVRECLEYFQKILDEKAQVTVRDDVKSVYSISYQQESGKNLRFSTSGFVGDGYLSKANIRKFISDLDKFTE